MDSHYWSFLICLVGWIVPTVGVSICFLWTDTRFGITPDDVYDWFFGE